MLAHLFLPEMVVDPQVLGGQEHFQKICPGPEVPHAYFKSLRY